jgi:hypothetical protein
MRIDRRLLLLLLLPCIASASFAPAVRVDQETRENYACYHADIALGPELDGSQPIYVAFENDSVPFTIQRSDIAFQRSTDYGQTWLSSDIIVRRGNLFACYPDLKVGRDGTIYLVYTDRIDGSQRSIKVVLRSSSIVLRSSFIVLRSSFIVHRSSLIVSASCT